MIVITGAGIVSALGVGQEATWQALQTGRCGIASPQYLTTHHPLPVGEVPMSNAEMAERTHAAAEVTSRTALMGIMALGEALQSAQIVAAQLPKVALVSGTTVGNMDVTEQEFARTLQAETLGLCGMCTDQIGEHFGTWGYTTTLSTACSSAANAFVHGAMLIESGAFDCVVVGGSEALSRFHYNGFRSLLILDPSPCRPFDRDRAGLNLGEGAAFVVLERESHALARGVQPLCTFSGWGNACDAFHQTASSDDGEGAVRAMQQALRQAHLQPADIGYINAHGTGTPNNDASELSAIRRVFPQVPPLSSTKSATGHTTSASGSVEMVICLLALQHQLLPASLHWSASIDGDFQPITAPTSVVGLRHVLCNAFAFGGNDTSLVISAYAPQENQPHATDVLVKTTEKIVPTSEEKAATSEINSVASEGIQETSEEIQKTSEEISRISDEISKTSEIISTTSDGISKTSERIAATSEGTSNSAERKRETSAIADCPSQGGGSPFSAASPRAVYLKALLRHEDIAPTEMPKIPPMVARRLTPLLRRGLQTSLAVLSQVGVPSPQAIITGTAMGCVTDTERFLRTLVEQDEEFLSPTHFIHSTHNTLSGLVAIHTKSHGYNVTFSHGTASYDHALRDAFLLLSQGHADNALVGAHDEAEMLSVAYYLDTRPEGALCRVLPTTSFAQLCSR